MIAFLLYSSTPLNRKGEERGCINAVKEEEHCAEKNKVYQASPHFLLLSKEKYELRLLDMFTLMVMTSTYFVAKMSSCNNKCFSAKAHFMHYLYIGRM